MVTGGTLAFVVTIAFMALFGSIGHSLILYFTLGLGSIVFNIFITEDCASRLIEQSAVDNQLDDWQSRLL